MQILDRRVEQGGVGVRVQGSKNSLSHALLLPSISSPRFSGTLAQKGQSILELLLVLLVLVPLLFGGIELARGVSIRHSLASGTLVAMRSLSLEPANWTWATGTIQASIDANVLGNGALGSLDIQAYDSSGSPISSGALAGLPFGTPFRLEASVNYTPDIPLVGGSTITLRVSHWGIVERYP